jgi:aminotransferase
MTRLALSVGAVNLSQGYPDFDPPAAIVEAAKAAIDGGDNQYTNPWGWPLLRQRLADHYRAGLGWDVDPDRHVTVTCGVTEGLTSVMLAVLDPGDEVLVLEPAHDNYWPTVRFAGAVPVPVALDGPAYALDVERLAAAVTPRTKVLLLNTPHNPTGRVFAAAELDALADLVVRHDLLLVTDEIYDRLVYDGHRHVCPGALGPLADRTVTVSGLGKTFAVTGWRLGYVVAPEPFAGAVRKVHDFLTICAPTPLQAAAAAALDLPPAYYESLVAEYAERRAVALDVLRGVGFEVASPEGAYYLLADYRGLPVPQASSGPTAFARWLTESVGVAVVPGDAAYSLEGHGAGTVRVAFCKRLGTLRAAGDRLASALA